MRGACGSSAAHRSLGCPSVLRAWRAVLARAGGWQLGWGFKGLCQLRWVQHWGLAWLVPFADSSRAAAG